MKGRNVYNKNSYKFFKATVERKRNESKGILKNIYAKTRRRYGLFKKLMRANKLELISKMRIKHKQADRVNAFNDIYSYKSKSFVELKNILTTDKNGRIKNLCPYCQMEIVCSFDHILPMSEFPEYSANPYNLMPCCTTCNAKKNNVWKNNGVRCFINFYIDNIPDIQYFFADVKVSDNNIFVDFNLKFPSGYDEDLKDIITQHYEKLELVKRYKENSGDKLESLNIDVKPLVGKLADDEIIYVVNKKITDMRHEYGYNYWVAVLYEACINDTNVLNYLKQQH